MIKERILLEITKNIKDVDLYSMNTLYISKIVYIYIYVNYLKILKKLKINLKNY